MQRRDTAKVIKRFPTLGKRIINKRTLIVLAFLTLLGSFLGAWIIKQRAERSIAVQRTQLAKQNIIPFEHKLYSQLNNPELSIWQSYKTSRAMEKFNDSIFVATDGGLVELGQAGDLRHHYTILDGLPESDLLSLASFNSKLFIGTRTCGLVAFDGARFEGFRWTDRESQSIDALLSDSGRLLIGTRAAGLIAFDGSQFKELTVGPEHKRLVEVTFLSRSGGRLFIGTFSDGLWIQDGASWSHFTTADGLLSNRIVGIATNSDNLFVASDYGLATTQLGDLSTSTSESSQARFLTVAALPSMSSLVQHGDKLVLCTDNGETLGVPIEAAFSQLRRSIPAASIRGSITTGSKIATLGEDLWRLSSEGVQRAANQSDTQAAIRFSRWSEVRQTLASNLISALAVDSQSRVWAGTFRNGIDVLGPSGTPVAHVESESAREINSLVEDGGSKKMLAASSAGLLSFDAALGTKEHLSVANGLLSNSVMQVTQLADGHLERSMLVLATSKGLSLGMQGKFRGVTTVQGLPSNSLYAVLDHGGKLYVGTLGGLAILQDGRVNRVFSDTNSKLTNNWVTALCAVGPRVFAGTYGGGVFELTASGEVRPFLPEIGRAVVNPNAMWSDGLRLFIGTLDGALMVDLNSQQLIRIRREMPARTVLSITGDERYVYFGTTAGIARIGHRYWSEN